MSLIRTAREENAQENAKSADGHDVVQTRRGDQQRVDAVHLAVTQPFESGQAGHEHGRADGRQCKP